MLTTGKKNLKPGRRIFRVHMSPCVSLIKEKDQIVAVIQSERENVAVGVEERYKNIYSKIWEHNNGDKMSCEHDMRELEKQ